MSSSWFNVDINSLQSSILDSVGEASKIMDELNLDNMQDDARSKDSAKAPRTPEEVVHTPSRMHQDGVEPESSFYRQDLDVALKPSEVPLDVPGKVNAIGYSAGIDQLAETEEVEQVVEMEEVVELTEFGVPIRTMQPRTVPVVHRTQVCDTDEKQKTASKEGKGGQSFSRLMWTLDSMQEEEEDKEYTADLTSPPTPPSQFAPLDTLSPSVEMNKDEDINDQMDHSEDILSPLPQYVSRTLLAEYTYPASISGVFSTPVDDLTEEGVHNSEVEVDVHADESSDDGEDEGDDAGRSEVGGYSGEEGESEQASSFFGAAAASLLQNATANMPNSIFNKPSFFEEADDEGEEEEDPIFRRVEMNKINPPPPREAYQSVFQSGEKLISNVYRTDDVEGDNCRILLIKKITPVEIRRQSRAYGAVSKVITVVMWLLRVVWTLLSSLCCGVVATLSSMFDCPSSPTSSLPMSVSVATNICEDLQHPASRARLAAEGRVFLFNTVVSNNFIAVMTILLLVASYWKFRRYGTDSGD